jgi:hypothetical protein
MGVGLVIAVLGLGSTFAANIQINNDTTEFGQGVTRTVYCGEGEDEITITPVSRFVNGRSNRSEAIEAIPARWIAPTWSGTPTFQEVSDESSKNRFESTYVNDTTGASSTIRGYWVSSRSSSNYYTGNNNSPSGYVFVPQAVGNSNSNYVTRSLSTSTSGSQKYGYWKFQSWTPGSMSVAVAGVPSVTSRSESKFELKSITVSDIDGECEGRDFILSAYGAEGDSPVPLINSKKFITVLFEDVSRTAPAVFSFNRTGRTDRPTRFATVTNENNGKFIITFVTEDNDLLDTRDFENIVIETQDDVLGNWSPGNYVDDEDDEGDDD